MSVKAKIKIRDAREKRRFTHEQLLSEADGLKIGDIGDAKDGQLPGLPDEAHRIVLTPSVSSKGESYDCSYTNMRQHVETVQPIMAAHVGTLPASEAIWEGVA
jgi:hypothetical protein